MGEIFERQQAGGLTGLPAKGSLNFDANGSDWQACGSDGFWIKPLLEDVSEGLRTWLMRVDPGAFSPPHRHQDIEQIYVIDGSFYDQDGTYGPGEFIVRAPGAEHSAGSEDGALVLLCYMPLSGAGR